VRGDGVEPPQPVELSNVQPTHLCSLVASYSPAGATPRLPGKMSEAQEHGADPRVGKLRIERNPDAPKAPVLPLAPHPDMLCLISYSTIL